MPQLTQQNIAQLTEHLLSAALTNERLANLSLNELRESVNTVRKDLPQEIANVVSGDVIGRVNQLIIDMSATMSDSIVQQLRKTADAAKDAAQLYESRARQLREETVPVAAIAAACAFVGALVGTWFGHLSWGWFQQ
jgi:hypothetical protein